MSGDEARVLDALRVCLGSLLPAAQRRVVTELAREIQPIGVPRAGDVLAALVQWMPPCGKWTVDEARQAVAASGVEASAKEGYNAVAYLTRRRHIKRTGYGRYITAEGPQFVRPPPSSACSGRATP